MSQAYKIYDFLAQTDNRAADKALLLAMRRAEPPYGTALLETILDRAQAASTAELVSRFHQLPLAWRSLLVERADSLYSGLRQTSQAPDRQARINTLSIINRGHCYRLADVATVMLRDHDSHISRRAGDVLDELALSLASEPCHVTSSASADPGVTPDDPFDKEFGNHQTFLTVLGPAVRNFQIHRRPEAITAAMYLVPADNRAFWGDCLETYHPVGQVVRQVMVNYDRQELANFCVSALQHHSLRPVAARAIANHQRGEFVGAVARAFRAHPNHATARGLKLVKQPRWLSPEALPPELLGDTEQKALPFLVAGLGADAGAKAEYLRFLAQQTEEPVALRAVAALARMDPADSLAELAELIDSPYETVALAAMIQLLRKKHSNLRRIMIAQLGSPHPRVQALAQGYYRKIAFWNYWNNFDNLGPREQFAAGRAVYKIDPQAQLRWLQCARRPASHQRLRAIRIARILGRVDQCYSEITRLTRDRDSKVRSFAVAALGELTSSSGATEASLLKALNDKNVRVQANAIEALEARDARRVADRLERFINSPNNRVRANAVKALMKWNVSSAGHSMHKLLTDPRLSHRRSGCWVVRTLQGTDKDKSPQSRPKRASQPESTDNVIMVAN